MFIALKFIEALDLSGCHLTELAYSIGNLSQLRYLDLSFTLLNSLPYCIDGLQELQTLNLKGCKHLHELPKYMKDLIKLRHLHFDILCQLTSMPKGIGALTELRTLSAFIVKAQDDDCNIKELRYLNNISGSIHISGLENMMVYHDVDQAALHDKKHITKLQLSWNPNKSYGPEEELAVFKSTEQFKPSSSSLIELEMRFYPGSRLPTWIGSGEFEKLVRITLMQCENTQLNASIGDLPNLKYLHIMDLDQVKTITHFFLGGFNDSSVGFSKLERLVIDGMRSLETWEGVKYGDFPLLYELTINHCPKLIGVQFLQYLNSLKHLRIDHCGELKSLPKKALSAALHTLIINDSPLLEKSCSKGGEDWPKIEHIPNIWIDLEDIRATCGDGDADSDSDD
ncbi:disease resistance protein RGA2-like [Spinacia oleracea]|uniref:Disease resistance protein RGA2-like n=1 Tax=Spinacia oleracea TaxID=3562 RepID=A0ABM3R4R4_SPIOL|nr:disease resistance protein RGA2-like [Spinacia oleracea]